jgi:hypothetical protein
LWTVETIVDGAIAGGCTPEQAVEVFRSIWYYTVGEILVRAHSARAREEGPAPAPRPGFFGSVDAARLPRLAALGDRWPVVAARDTYRQGLEAFVAGLLARASDPGSSVDRSGSATVRTHARAGTR